MKRIINKKQKNAMKSPYLGIFCRKEPIDMGALEYLCLYYIYIKINNNPKVIINIKICAKQDSNLRVLR
jgi:hypothetical protein